MDRRKEITPLVTNKKTSTTITRRRVMVACGLLLLVIIFAVYAAIGVGVWYGWRTVSDSSLHVPLAPSFCIASNSCVPLLYHINTGLLHDSYSLDFTLPPGAQIYTSKTTIVSYEQFQDLDLEFQANFSNCPNQTCLFKFGSYIHSFINATYNITNDGHISGNVFQVLVFDSLDPYSTPIKTFSMDTENLNFTFDAKEINSCSLYFFISIKLVHGPAIANFRISRVGVQAQYNISDITPYCTVGNITTNSSNHDRCQLPVLNNKMSILACLQEQLPEEVSTINVTIAGPNTSIIGYSIIFIPYTISFVFVIVIALLVCWCCKNRGCSKRRSGSLLVESCDTFANRTFEDTGNDPLIDVEVLYKRDAINDGGISDTDSTSTTSTMETEEPAEPPQTTGKLCSVFTDPGIHNTDAQTVDVAHDEGYTTVESTILHSKDSLDDTCSSDPMGSPDPCMRHVTIVQFTSKGLFHHFKECGVTIVIPKGAVTDLTELQLGTSLLFPGFKCEGPYGPVSQFIWAHIDKPLSKEAYLYIPHNGAGGMELVLLVKGHEKDDVFKVKTDAIVRSFDSDFLVPVEMTHFCVLCLAQAMEGNPPERAYQIAFFEQLSIDGSRSEIHVCVLHNLICLEGLKKRYLNKRFKLIHLEQLSKAIISDEGITFSTDLTSDNEHWEMFEIQKQQTSIKESDIDVLQFLNCPSYEKVTDKHLHDLQTYEKEDTYPRRFRFVFYSKTSKIERQAVKIFLKGFKNIDPIVYTKIFGEQPQVVTDPSSKEEDEPPLIVDVMPYIEPALNEPDMYLEFGRNLGLPMDLLTKIEMKHSPNVKHCLMQILLHAAQRRTVPAAVSPLTYGDISEALLSCGYPVLSVLIMRVFMTTEEDTLSVSPPDDYVVIEGPTILKSSIGGYEIIKEKLYKLPNGYDILQYKPSMSDLNSVVYPHIAAKWMEFGTQVKINPSILQAIDREKRGRSQECFNNMIAAWKKNDTPSFTWATVVRVLYSPGVKGYRAGEEVYMHLLHNYSLKMQGIVDT